MRDLIIIGGGPAAAVAAVYALGKQLDFLVIYETLGKAGRTHGLMLDAPRWAAIAEATRSRTRCRLAS